MCAIFHFIKIAKCFIMSIMSDGLTTGYPIAKYLN